MQSAADKYIKASFVLKLTFSVGGVVGIRKCILQQIKKAQNQLNTLHKLMLTIQVLADITEQLRRTNGFQSKRPKEHSLSKGKCMKSYKIMFLSSFSNCLVQR